MRPPLNLILVAVLVFYAIFFRNYPWRTRFGTGRTPSLSGIQLYQEQLKYIRQGIVTASAYLAIAVASIAAVIKIYTAKFAYEAAERKLVGDDLAWYANARQTEWGQRVEAAVMFLFVVGVWLIVASCLRWINIISCRIQLRKRQPVVSVIPPEQDPNAYVTAEKPGHSVFTSKAIAIIGCAVALCVISILVGVVRSNSFGKESHPGQQAVSLNNGTTQSGPGTNATLIHTVARSGFWLGTYGQDPFFRQEGGEEHPVTPPEVAVLLDAGGDTYIGKVDKLPNVLPLTEQIWHSEMSSHYLLVEGMDYANWTSGATEHPDGALPMVVRALCRQKIAVSVLEDTMISEDGEVYKDACAVFQNPQAAASSSAGEDTTASATAQSARHFAPHEILQICKGNTSVPSFISKLGGGTSAQLNLYECEGFHKFLMVSDTERHELCSLDFTEANIDDGFHIRFVPSGVVIATTGLAGSNGEPPSWTVELTRRNGQLTATSEDYVAPKVECEH